MVFNKITGLAALVALSTLGASAFDFAGYQNAVSEMNFDNVGIEGSYNQITSMDPKSCSCESSPRPFGGAAAPLNEELVAIVRGPIKLEKFAVYMPGGNSKRDVEPSHVRRHVHHRRHKIEQRDIKTVTKTKTSTKIVWIDAPTPTPTAEPKVKIAEVGDEEDEEDTTPKKVVEKKKTSVDSETSNGSGKYQRVAYYDADAGKAEGLVFLAHKGKDGVSGTFDTCFGNSLSYVTSDLQGPCESPEVLAKQLVPSNNEFVIASAASCEDGGCGYVRPGTQAHHGWSGTDKIFVFEFSMPDDFSSDFNKNMPSLWLLNQQIVNTLQYGKPECSCWKTGCGELDVFEVLEGNHDKAITALHGKKAGMGVGHFSRPKDQTMKLAVVFSGNKASIRRLPSSTSFTSRLDDFEKETGGAAAADYTVSS